MVTIKLKSKIDSGGCGEVFVANVVENNQKVAVKRLAAPYTKEDAKRFDREVRLMQSLDHPNIIKLLYTRLDSDPPAYVMPLAENSLNSILSDLRINEARRTSIFEQVLSGIQFAHENGVIHRDLKPRNVLMFREDKAVIADFGSGRFVNRDTTVLTGSREQLGTLMYAAPELFTNFSLADERSDIYSLGKILLEMLSSKPIFPVHSFVGLEVKYVYILEKCLDNDPDKRYQSVKELAEDFRLLNQKRYSVESPLKIAQKLISNTIDPAAVAETTTVSNLIRTFCDNIDDQELYTEILPRLPVEIFKKMISQHSQSFTTIIKIYDNFVSGSLPFSYCDVVADFYYRIFVLFDDLGIRRLIIRRLLTLGVSHNRWHVREVLSSLLENIRDPGLARVALESCRSDIEGIQWSSAAFDINKMHPLLRDGIKQILRPINQEEEIPF